MSHKVSVITICYNCANTIQKTIDSVVGQTYDNIEYIIIDGASNDGTVDIIKANENNISLWISEKDNGIYDAMGKGLTHASGDWLIFINAGDSFASNDVLAKIFDSEKDLDGYSAIYGDMAKEGLDGSVGVVKAHPFYKSKRSMPAMGFSHQSVFLCTKMAQEIGFDGCYRVAADYAMVYAIYQKSPHFLYVPIPVGCIEPAGFSHQNKRLWLEEMARITGCIGLSKCIEINKRIFLYWVMDLKQKVSSK